MDTDRLRIYAFGTAVEQAGGRALEAARPADTSADVSPGGPPCRLLWCRVTSGAPGDPPDERYYADEVRPVGGDGDRLQWEAVPGGLQQVVVHNVAESDAGSHLVPEDTVVRVEERLGRGSPPDLVYLAHVTVAQDTERLARVVSYESGTYTVQPVRRLTGGFENDGDPIAGVPNLGELWTEEAGYLAGPSGYDRYVRIFQTPAGWTLLLHPPRRA